jgi:serine/threonine protein kinase
MEPLSANDPRTVGEFRLHARLGAGGMGQVYLGFSPAGRAVAIKVVHPQFARDQEFLARFSREVAAAGSVSGMYTAPVVGSGLSDDPPWLATAYVPGPPLAAVVTRHGPLPEAATWRLAAGLAEALRAVHAAGLVHRDLKPANVLLADDGPHVIDFGISRAFQGTQLTSAGMVIGTPGYMSPEQAESEAAGPESDIFSLGCVLAYTATGNPPFGTGAAASILYRVVTTEPDLSAVSPALRQVIEACLKKDPAQRPGTSQLISMIFSLGPTTAATLGSFWPDSVARVIATEQASQTPAGLTPPAQAVGEAWGPTETAGPVAAAGRVQAASPVSPVSPVSPPPAERQPTALAMPAQGQGGGSSPTGHAPMISDGYYAAAAQPWAGNPVTPGPVMPPVSPVPQSYAGQPQTGYTPGGQQSPSGGQAYPGGQQYPGQASGGSGGFIGTGSGGQTPYGSTPYGQPSSTTPYPNQAGPASWPPQQGGATPWPAGSDALSQYRLGSRKPMTNEVPEVVLIAVRLMYAGFAATCAALVTSLIMLGKYARAATAWKDHAATAATLGLRHVALVDQAKQSAQNQMAGAMVIAVVAAVLGLACWAVIAVASRRGRGWTRIASTVLIGLYTLVVLLVCVSTHNDPGARFTTLLVWAIGLAAVIPLWSRGARDFCYAWRKR